MVYHGENEATKTGVVAKGIISKIHNMAWLKHRITDPNQNVREEGEMSENPTDKKYKRKKKSKGQKEMGNYTQKSSNPFSVGGASSAPPENVWGLSKNVAEVLFPKNEFVPDEELIDDEMKKAMEESLRMSQMMKECALEEIQKEAQEEIQKGPQELAQKEEKVEDGGQMSDDDFSWDKVNRNLPPTDEKEFRKNFDTNNNSGLDKLGNLAIETENTERKGRFITARKSSMDEILKSRNDVNTSLPLAIKPSFIDQYGRPDGRSETHLCMGKGGRKREQQLLEQIQHGNSSMTNTKAPIQQRDENKTDPRRSTNKNMTCEETSNNDSNDGRSMNHQQKRQSTNRPQEGRSTNSLHEKQSSNYEDNRRSMSYSRSAPRSQIIDKYHFNSKFQKPMRECHDHTHRNRRETNNETSHREEKLQKPEERQKIVRPVESSTRSSDHVVEKIKNEKIEPSDKTAKNSNETYENSLEMAVSKLPRLADFHSRDNVPIVDENPTTSIFPPDVASNSQSPDQDSQTSHYSDASANFSQNDEISQYSQFFVAPPGFHCMSQPPPLCTAPNCIHVQESQYASLQLTDPSLHKVFMQKKNRDCCAHRENCSNYENSLIQVDPNEMMKSYGSHLLTPEQQVLNYDMEMSGKLSGNVSSHITRYPAQVAIQGFPSMMRIDNTACGLTQQISDGGRESSQMRMQPVCFVSGSVSPANYVHYPNNSQDSQNSYQNVQCPLNLQPIIRESQTRPPGFDNIGPNNSSSHIQSLPHGFHFPPPPFCPSTSGIHGNPSQPQMAQDCTYFPPTTIIPKELIDNRENPRHFPTSEQRPMIPQRNCENYRTSSTKNFQNSPSHENFDRNPIRSEIPPSVLRKNSGGIISHNIPNQGNFNLPPARRESPSMILQRSNVDISPTFANPPFPSSENGRAFNSGRGRGRIDKNH